MKSAVPRFQYLCSAASAYERKQIQNTKLITQCTFSTCVPQHQDLREIKLRMEGRRRRSCRLSFTCPCHALELINRLMIYQTTNLHVQNFDTICCIIWWTTGSLGPAAQHQ